MAGRRAWVLGGGGARGAAQVGVLLALFEAGVGAPERLYGTSVGALNASTLAAYPSLAGAQMLRQTWFSRQARDVFQADPVGVLWGNLRGSRLAALPPANLDRLVNRQLNLLGVSRFEHLRVPLAVVVTDFAAGQPVVLRSGLLGPALRASAAIPGVFPAVSIGGHDYVDGGVVDNLPVDVAIEDGARAVLAVELMASPPRDTPPSTWPELIARTLQLSLHQRVRADFLRLRERARVVVIAPVIPASEGWDLRPARVDRLIEASRVATARLLARSGSGLFRRSGFHLVNLELGG